MRWARRALSWLGGPSCVWKPGRAQGFVPSRRLPNDRKTDARVFPAALDVMETAAIVPAVESVAERSGAIDALVNAGRGLPSALEEISDAEARSLFDRNVFGLIIVIRAVQPYRRRREASSPRIALRFATKPGVSRYRASECRQVSARPGRWSWRRSVLVEPGVFRRQLGASLPRRVCRTRARRAALSPGVIRPTSAPDPDSPRVRRETPAP